MKRLAIILTLLVAGCGEHITPKHLQVVEDHCSHNGGLYQITEGDSYKNGYWVTFRCNNGAKFKLAWNDK